MPHFSVIENCSWMGQRCNGLGYKAKHEEPPTLTQAHVHQGVAIHHAQVANREMR